MMNEKVNPYCGRISECRKEKGYTQQSLAEKVAITKQFLSALENGRRRLTADVAYSIAGVLGVRMEYLLGKDDFKTQKELDTQQRYAPTISDEEFTRLSRLRVVDADFSKLIFGNEHRYFSCMGDIEYDDGSVTIKQECRKIPNEIYEFFMQDISDYIFLKSEQMVRLSRVISDEQQKENHLWAKYFDADYIAEIRGYAFDTLSGENADNVDAFLKGANDDERKFYEWCLKKYQK